MKTKKQLVESGMKKVFSKMISEQPNRIHPADTILVGITFEDLVTAVSSNEPTIDKMSIMRTFNEMVKANLEDAKYELQSNMDSVIKWAQSGYAGKPR